MKEHHGACLLLSYALPCLRKHSSYGYCGSSYQLLVALKICFTRPMAGPMDHNPVRLTSIPLARTSVLGTNQTHRFEKATLFGCDLVSFSSDALLALIFKVKA